MQLLTVQVNANLGDNAQESAFGALLLYKLPIPLSHNVFEWFASHLRVQV